MDRNKSRNQGENYEGDVLVAEKDPSSAGPALDVDAYRPYIEDFDLTEEQAAELLRTLWEIMKAFVDLGFGVDSIHHFIPALGDVSRALESEAAELGDKRLTGELNRAALTGAEKEGDS
ncbi:MAG: hypothetical protein AAF724_14905 [Pseudomonadota bacterium]